MSSKIFKGIWIVALSVFLASFVFIMCISYNYFTELQKSRLKNEAELAAQEENLAELKKQLAEEQAMIAKASKMSWRDISEVQFQEGDRDLLACLIYCEAGNQPYVGQVAVGAVVMNRIRHPSFPSTIAGVIYQRGAFTAVSDGQINLAPDDTALKAAKDAMNGWDPTGGCLFYYNPAIATSAWIRSRPVALRIGEHVFCK